MSKNQFYSSDFFFLHLVSHKTPSGFYSSLGFHGTQLKKPSFLICLLVYQCLLFLLSVLYCELFLWWLYKHLNVIIIGCTLSFCFFFYNAAYCFHFSHWSSCMREGASVCWNVASSCPFMLYTMKYFDCWNSKWKPKMI